MTEWDDDLDVTVGKVADWVYNLNLPTAAHLEQFLGRVAERVHAIARENADHHLRQMRDTAYWPETRAYLLDALRGTHD